MIFNFSAYSFIRRDEKAWISLGCIRDDKKGDALQYDYALPLPSDVDPVKAELGAMYELASTARLVLPIGPECHVVWKVTTEDVLQAVRADANLLIRLAEASDTFDLDIMEENIQTAALKEIAGEPPSNEETNDNGTISENTSP